MSTLTFQLGTGLILLILGYFFGRYFEKKHFESIIKREAELANIIAVLTKTPTPED